MLSVDEIKDVIDKHGKVLRRAVGTDFAKTKKPDGCSLYVYDKTNKDNYIIGSGEEVGCSWWWLRTQETSLRVRFLSAQVAVFVAARMSVQPVTACAPH